MKKFVNEVENILTESLTGFGKAHSDIIDVRLSPDFVFRKNKSQNDKVALISGGGSGHEPLHGGFVGYGMLDAACPGQVLVLQLLIKWKLQQMKFIKTKGFLLLLRIIQGHYEF